MLFLDEDYNVDMPADLSDHEYDPAFEFELETDQEKEERLDFELQLRDFNETNRQEFWDLI